MSSYKNIYSGIVGKACQECNIPPNCTLEASIVFSDKTEIYRQEHQFFRRFTYLIEPKNGSSVPLKLTATPMNCISHNPNCPMGNVFNEDGSLYGDFSAQKGFDDVIEYTKPLYGISISENNPISLLSSFIHREGFTDDPRYRQRYSMRLSECDAVPFLTIPKMIKLLQVGLSPMANGAALLYQEGRRQLASAQFDLILYRELKISVEIGFESALAEKDNEMRKKEQIKKNVARGYKPSHGGWTKHTKKYGIKRGLGIKGEVASTIGDETVAFNTELKKEFISNKDKLSLVNSIDKGFNVINDLLQKGGKSNYPLVSTEFCYPVLKVEGGIKTHQSQDNGVITQGNVSVGFAPLFGFQITVDLLTFFATYMRMSFIVDKVRKAAENSEAVKDGEDGAYAVLKLDLMFSFGLHGNFKFKTDDEGKFGSDGREMKLQGELIGDAHVEGGAKYWGASGFFQAGAEIKTTLNMDFDKEDGDDLTAVIYHDGIKAKVYGHYSVGFDDENSDDNKIPDDLISGGYKEWIIYDALDKEKSTWRFSLD